MSFKIPYLSKNVFLLRKKFRLREILIFIFAEILALVTAFQIAMTWGQNSYALTLLPAFALIVIAGFFVIGHYREIEVTPHVLKIFRWGEHGLTLTKENVASIEINHGLRIKPHYRRHHHYARIYITLHAGKTLDMYKINSLHISAFKHSLAEFGYPAITETFRGRPMTEADRKLI